MRRDEGRAHATAPAEVQARHLQHHRHARRAAAVRGLAVSTHVLRRKQAAAHHAMCPHHAERRVARARQPRQERASAATRHTVQHVSATQANRSCRHARASGHGPPQQHVCVALPNHAHARASMRKHACSAPSHAKLLMWCTSHMQLLITCAQVGALAKQEHSPQCYRRHYSSPW